MIFVALLFVAVIAGIEIILFKLCEAFAWGKWVVLAAVIVAIFSVPLFISAVTP